MFIQYNGNVGIGTITPSYTLDVNGTANITDTIFSRNIDNLQDQTTTNIIPTLTGNPTTISNAVSPYRFQNGTYTLVTSTAVTSSYLAFTTDIVNGWKSGNNYVYNGSTYSPVNGWVTYVGSTPYNGDYLQIKLPNLFKISSMSYYTESATYNTLLGSTDGSSWTFIGTFTNSNTTIAYTTATFSTTSYFTYFRIVVFQTRNVFARLCNVQMFGVVRSVDGNTLRLTATGGVLINGSMTTQNITSTSITTTGNMSCGSAITYTYPNVNFNINGGGGSITTFTMPSGGVYKIFIDGQGKNDINLMCCMEFMCGNQGTPRLFNINHSGYFSMDTSSASPLGFRLWSGNLPSNYTSFSVSYFKMY